MSIMDFFRGQPAAAGATPNPGGTSGQQQVPVGADPNNPLIPAGTVKTQDTTVGGAGNDTLGGAGAVDKSPLADFSKLWETTPSKGPDGKEIVQDDPLSILPNMQADPAKMYEAAKRIDFSKVMNPEKVKAALTGDSAAFSEVINSVAQAAFANSAMANTRIVEAALKQMTGKLFDTAIPHLVKKHSTRETVVSDNPIFADPAVAPMLSMLESQLQSKFPQASAKEISDMAKRYINGLGKALTGTDLDNPNNKDGTGPRGGKGGKPNSGAEEDWSTFLAA